MWLHKISQERHFLLLHLLIISFARASGASEMARDKNVSEDTSLKNEYTAREETTTALLLPVTDTDLKPTSPIAVTGNDPQNDPDGFRPSLHLGEIVEQSTIRMNPFNNVQDVKFESNVHRDAQRERYQEVLQEAYQSVPSVLDEATRPSRIKFQDDSVIRQPVYLGPLDDHRSQTAVAESSRSSFDEAGDFRHVFLDPAYFQNAEEPSEAQDASAIFGKSKTEHGLTAGATYYDLSSRSPYAIGYHTDGGPTAQTAYQPLQHETAYEITGKPENGVLVLRQQESTYTRKRKFPYPFYQPYGGYHNGMEFAEELPRHTAAVYPQMGKISPWKKIIHLIGTFLPLGLLLATLTPNVIRIDNTTRPNIVLSKLRAADLPVEHKLARSLDDESAGCEDRSICELILAGGEPKSNILQNILWNLATRISDDVAKRNGLRDVFNAVKKKDCTKISC